MCPGMATGDNGPCFGIPADGFYQIQKRACRVVMEMLKEGDN